MSNYIEEKLKEFDRELVEMNLFKGRDMYNRPPLYDTPDEKIEEIKQFIKQALQEQEERIREEEYQRRKEEKCETAEVNYQAGYARAKQEIKEKIKELKVDEMAASGGINVLKERTSDNLNYRLKTGHKIEWAMAELYNKALEDILKELNI